MIFFQHISYVLTPDTPFIITETEFVHLFLDLALFQKLVLSFVLRSNAILSAVCCSL